MNDYILSIISITDKIEVLDTSKYLGIYLGDIVAVEDVSNTKDISLLLSNVVKMIIVSNHTQLIKLRLGVDDRYNDTVSLEELKDKKLLDKKELKKLSNEEEVRKHIRKLYRLKWRATEVILGEKELRYGKRIKFDEALSTYPVVKLSLVTWVSHRLQRIDVTYLLPGGLEVCLRDNKPSNDIRKAWISAICLDEDSILRAIESRYDPIIATLDQTLSDIKTLKKISEPISQIIFLVLEIKKRLIHLNMYSDICDDILRLWVAYKRYDSFDYQLFYSYLDKLESHIKK